MIRSALLLMILSTPALAAGAHLQPKPGMTETAQAAPSNAATGSKGFDPEMTKKAEANAVARDKAWDAKLKKTMSGVCKGC